MNRTTSLDDRIRISEWAAAGMTDRQIASHLGWSQATVRKWRRKQRQLGRAALTPPQGRPTTGALGSFPPDIQQTIAYWRHTHPGWGPATLAAELKRHPAFQGRTLPSPASIARFLQQQGLVRPYQSHQPLPPVELPPVAPHAIWQLDAPGETPVPDVGVVSLINLTDRASHVRLLSYPCVLGATRAQRHATTEDYQLALRLAFTDWGKPQQVQVDHDSVFFDQRSKSPFPTRLHLWLLSLGISLIFSRIGRPTDQGMTERCHQLWAAQVLEGQTFSDWSSLYLALQDRRDFLNWHLPCASLEHRPPLVACPNALHSGDKYRPEWETSQIQLEQVYGYLAQGRWFRQVSRAGTLWLGGRAYYLGQAYSNQEVELRVAAASKRLICSTGQGQVVKECPMQGLEIEDLIGELASHINLPCFQLELPLDPPTQRVVRLYERMGV